MAPRQCPCWLLWPSPASLWPSCRPQAILGFIARFRSLLCSLAGQRLSPEPTFELSSVQWLPSDAQQALLLAHDHPLFRLSVQAAIRGLKVVTGLIWWHLEAFGAPPLGRVVTNSCLWCLGVSGPVSGASLAATGESLVPQGVMAGHCWLQEAFWSLWRPSGVSSQLTEPSGASLWSLASLALRLAPHWRPLERLWCHLAMAGHCWLHVAIWCLWRPSGVSSQLSWPSGVSPGSSGATEPLRGHQPNIASPRCLKQITFPRNFLW